MRSSPEPVRTTVKSSGALPCGSAASQRLTPQVACWRSLAAGSFPEVLRPTALAALPVTSRGLCLPATFRPQGLVTLPTVSSRQSLASRVSGWQRSWAWPFRGSSLLRWSSLVGWAAPTRGFLACPCPGANTGPAAGAATSRVCPAAVPVTRSGLLPPGLSVPLLGFSSLGSSIGQLGLLVGRSPPMVWPAVGHPNRTAPTRRLNRQPTVPVRLSPAHAGGRPHLAARRGQEAPLRFIRLPHF